MQVLLLGKKYSRTVGIWTIVIKRTDREGALLFSQTLHLDALELCGMVFERFY